MSERTVSAPGRICLFGEHQDYLGLPVIAMAIDLRIEIRGRFNETGIYDVDLPDVGEHERFEASFPVPYVRERDYLRSAANVLWRGGVRLPKGLEARVHGNIPINSGTSSSSALCVAWCGFLWSYSAGKAVPAEEVARAAHRAEVVEFGEPGGMMDHVLSALGSVRYVEFEPALEAQLLQSDLGAFVLGASGEPKDTKGILGRVRGGVETAFATLKSLYPDLTWRSVTLDHVREAGERLSAEQIKLLEGTIQNREITQQALETLRQVPLDRARLGELLLEHQRVNRELLGISTPRLDELINAAVRAGALGGKLNGSGGGGAMFAYAPEAPGRVAAALEGLGAKAYVIHADEGLRVET